MTEREAAVAMPPLLDTVRTSVDRELFQFLGEERAQIASEHPGFLPLFDEIDRIVRAGGKRLRPMFCWLGYRAAGGGDEPAIARVAAALELFHTFALIHDDVMDASASRRGAATIHVRMAELRAAEGDPHPDRFGISSAILAGDLAMVLADHLFLHSGFPPELLAAAFRRYNRMRVEVAVGQFLDIAESGRQVGEAEARRISLLKSGTYSVEAPLEVGAILAGAPLEVLSVLARYGTPLGEAFQVRDDLDGVERGELDLDQARPTVLLAKARELAAPAERRVLNLLGTGSLTDEDRLRAAEILRTSGAIEEARHHVRELAEASSAALGTDLLEPEAAGALRSLAAFIAGA